MPFFKKRWPLLLILTVFIVLKIPHLFYGYFWDESSMYAPGAIAMYIHGTSLMPNAIPVVYSHGHPLFFQATFSVWIAIFGHSHLAMHSLSLVLSLLLIVIVYEAGLNLFNEHVAVISTLLLVLNISFFVQSSFVIPDIMIALFFFSSLHLYVVKQYFWATVCFMLLCSTKESALVLVVVLGMDAAISIFNKRIPGKERAYRCAAVLIPVIPGMLFYIAQKKTTGYYIPPMSNSSKPVFDFGHTLYWMKTFLSVLFSFNKSYLFFALLLIICVAATVKKRNAIHSLLLLPAGCLLLLCNNDSHYTELAYSLLFISIFVAVVLSLYFSGYLKYGYEDKRQKFLTLSWLFIICYLYYFSVYNFQRRYEFSVLVFLFPITAALFDFFITQVTSKIYYATVVSILMIGAYTFISEKDTSDLNVFGSMRAQQSVVDYLESHGLYNKVISTSSSIDSVHLTDTYSGYLHSDRTFGHVKKRQTDSQTEYAVFASVPDYAAFESVDSNTDYMNCKNDTLYHRVYRFEAGASWAEIYARVKN